MNCYHFKAIIVKDLEEKKQAMWAKWERKLRVPLPEGFRDSMEKDYLDTLGGKKGLTDLEGGLEDFFRKVMELEYFPSPKIPKRPPQKRYKRSFEKRLHLVDFIIGRQLTVGNLRQKSFALRRRINWKQACKAWNEAYPYDSVTPEVLKATYYRAVAEKDVQQEYFDRKYHQYALQLGELLSRLIMGNEQALRRFGKALERFGQLAVTVFDTVGQFALNHRDDIENLLLLSEKLNSMSDSEREEYFKLLEKEAQDERTHN